MEKQDVQYPEYSNGELATIFGITKRTAAKQRREKTLGALPDGCSQPSQLSAIDEELKKKRTGKKKK